MKTDSGIFLIGLVLFIMLITSVVVIHIQLEQQMLGNLKRAADASSVELALEELDTVLDYIKANNLTSGYTSVVYRTPDEDVGFWYRNITDAHTEVADSLEATPLEKSNVLMKLRETLLDSGHQITYPRGLELFPNNRRWAFFVFVCLFAMAGSGLSIAVRTS